MPEKKKVGKATAKAKSPRTQRAKPAAGKKGTMVRVKQVRSGIGHAGTYRRTLRALGLRHHQQVITIADSPATRGALRKVRHLVEVTPVTEA